MKKFLSVLMALAMVLTCATFPAFAEDAQIAPIGVTSPFTAKSGYKLAGIIDGSEAANSNYFRASVNITSTGVKGDDANLNFTADLGMPHNITSLYTAFGSQFATGVAVWGSNDNATWTELADLTLSAQRSTSDISHEGYYRYVKVEAYATKDKDPAILEVTFYGNMDPDIVKIEGLNASNVTYAGASLRSAAKQNMDTLFDGDLTRTPSSAEAINGIQFLWTTSTTVKTIEVTLNEVANIHALKLYWGNSDWNALPAQTYNVYFAGEDGVYGEAAHSYTDAATGQNGKSRDDGVILSKIAEGVKKIKIEITAHYATGDPAIREIEIYKYNKEVVNVPATYTVKYVDEQGNEIADAKTVTENVYVGNTVTEEAVAVDGYKPTETTKTITLVDGENTITFTYEEKSNVSYTVNYVDGAGNPIADAKTVGAFEGEVVTEAAATVAGYFLNETEFVKTITLAAGGENTITFTYKKVLVPLTVSAKYAAGVSNSGGHATDWKSLYDGNVNRIVQYAPVGASYVEGTSPVEFTYTFGEITDFTTLTTISSANRANTVKIWTSMNGTDWTLVGTYEPKTVETKTVYTKADGTTVTTYVNEYDLTGARGTQVKFEVVASPAGAWCGIYEMMVGGAAATPVELSADNVVSAPNWGWTTSTITNGTASVLFDGKPASNAEGFFVHGYYEAANQPAAGINNIELDLGAIYDNPIIAIQGGASDWNYTHLMAYEIYVAGEDGVYGEAPVSGFDNGTNADTNKVRVDVHEIQAEGVRFVKIVPTYLLRRTVIGEISVYGTPNGTIEPDEPDTPVDPEKDPITLTPAGVSAPTNTDGKPFALATDGDDTTFYAVSGYYSTLTSTNYQMVFDIGYLGTLDSLDILWGASSWGNTTPNAYKVEVSSDGTTWTEKKSYSGIYDITTGAATDTISGENTVFGITTSKWAIDNNDTNVNAYTQGNILEKNLGWTDVRYVRVTVTSVQYRLAISEVTISSLPNEDQVILSKGGQIRIADAENDITAGLRFGASIIKMNAGLEGEYKYDDNAAVKFGMYMIPKDLLGGQTLTAYLVNGVQDALDVPAKKILSQDENFITFTAVLVDIPSAYNEWDITAVPYALKDGVYTYFDEMTKSYVGVATAALETTYNPSVISAMEDSEEKTALRQASYQLQYIQRGYDKPYTEQGERIIAKLKRGINMQGLDASTWSSWDSHISTVTSSSTYQNIKNAGFDHVRIPVDFRNAADSNGTLNTSKMTTYVDKAVDAAIGQGLVVLLDFHGWADIMLTDFDYFVTVWTNLATYYKDKYPENLIFELVNEPHTAEESDGDGGDLNLTNLVILQTRTVDAIRAIDPDRFICLATSGWNGIWTLRDSGIGSASMFRNTPLMNYQDTIVALHSYTPGEFTHQDMSWAGTGGQTYSWSDNQEAYEAAIKEELGYLVEFVEETGMHAILNEFGCNTGSSVSDADEAAYARTVVSCIKDNDKIAYTWWEYEQSFGMTSSGSWKTHILNEVMAE